MEKKTIRLLHNFHFWASCNLGLGYTAAAVIIEPLSNHDVCEYTREDIQIIVD